MSDNAHYVKSRDTCGDTSGQQPQLLAIDRGSADFATPHPFPPRHARLLCGPPHKYFPIFLDTPQRMRYRLLVINVTGVSDVEAF